MFLQAVEGWKTGEYGESLLNPSSCSHMHNLGFLPADSCKNTRSGLN